VRAHLPERVSPDPLREVPGPPLETSIERNTPFRFGWYLRLKSGNELKTSVGGQWVSPL
jgi:hypothetical protein